MSDKELEEYIKTIEPNFNSHLEKGTIEMSNEYYNLLEERMARLINENKELKKHLEVPETYDLKTLEDYKSYYEDTTKEKILEDTYIDYCAYVNLAHRYSELKKQLEEEKNKVREYSYKLSNFRCEETYENQQKEFIEYLENEIYSIESKGTGINYNCEYDSEEDYINAMKEQSRLNTLKEILSKYKQIIGKDINVSTKGGKE